MEMTEVTERVKSPLMRVSLMENKPKRKKIPKMMELSCPIGRELLGAVVWLIREVYGASQLREGFGCALTVTRE
jgi:hypothetical protein